MRIAVSCLLARSVDYNYAAIIILYILYTDSSLHRLIYIKSDVFLALFCYSTHSLIALLKAVKELYLLCSREQQDQYKEPAQSLQTRLKVHIQLASSSYLY